MTRILNGMCLCLVVTGSVAAGGAAFASAPASASESASKAAAALAGVSAEVTQHDDGTSAPTPPQLSPDERGIRGDRQTARFTISSEPQIVDVGIAFGFTTTLWFEGGCYAPSVGDKDVCGVVYNDKNPLNRFFILTPVANKPGSETNVTFRCEQGAKVIVRARQVPHDEAHFSVKMEFDPEESERVRVAVEEAMQRAAAEREAAVTEARAQGAAQERAAHLRGLLHRFSSEEDVEIGREDFVVAKVFRQIVVGRRGNIVFQVRNHTDNDIKLADATVEEEETGRVLDGAEMLTTDPVVPAGSTTLGVVGFDIPSDPGPLRLILHEDGPRRIVVDDIEF